MKRWYAAHVVMYFKFHDGSQDAYPVYEDVHIFHARDEDEVLERAAELGKMKEDTTCRVDDRPATLTFAGVRKVIACDFHGEPKDGEEATYSQFTVKSAEELKRLVAGKHVDVRYTE